MGQDTDLTFWADLANQVITEVECDCEPTLTVSRQSCHDGCHVSHVVELKHTTDCMSETLHRLEQQRAHFREN